MDPLVTHMVSFLAGTATGAAGGYFASKYTDKRRRKESRKESIENFYKVVSLMPELIGEMKVDFSNPEYVSVREFVVIPNKRVQFNSQQLRFFYYEDNFVDLKGKVAVLENHGYVIDVTPGKAPIYRITEEFRQHVLEASI